jgi:hypothetical protein
MNSSIFSENIQQVYLATRILLLEQL